MPYTIIAARNRRDATTLAGLLGLRGRDWRYPTYAATLDGIVVDRVILHPSFHDRPDKHAVRAALIRCIRKSRKAKVIDLKPKVLERLAASAARAAEDSLSTRAAASVLADDEVMAAGDRAAQQYAGTLAALAGSD